MKSFNRLTRQLPCHLSNIELQNYLAQLAVAVQDTDAEEDRQKSMKAEMKARLDELAARKARLALLISRKEEYRDVEVELLFIEPNTVQEVRCDTGELLRTRPLAENEQQLVMTLEEQ